MPGHTVRMRIGHDFNGLVFGVGLALACLVVARVVAGIHAEALDRSPFASGVTGVRRAELTSLGEVMAPARIELHQLTAGRTAEKSTNIRAWIDAIAVAIERFHQISPSTCDTASAVLLVGLDFG